MGDAKQTVDTAQAAMERLKIKQTAEILRNARGWSDRDISEAYEYAASLLDSINAVTPYALSPEKMAEAIAAASKRGKWSLISPDGNAWIGRDLPVIATVALSAMGGTLQQEIENGAQEEQHSAETGSQTP